MKVTTVWISSQVLEESPEAMGRILRDHLREVGDGVLAVLISEKRADARAVEERIAAGMTVVEDADA